MEDNLSGAIGRVEDQTNSFVLFCAVRGVDLSSLLVEFASELEPKEEYKGFTFDEWHRLTSIMNQKIIALQNFLDLENQTPGLQGKTTVEVYPSIHALTEKLQRCMSRAVASGKST
jgi:hypothetical protein